MIALIFELDVVARCGATAPNRPFMIAEVSVVENASNAENVLCGRLV